MGRSVSAPCGAHVAYSYWDGSQDEWDWIVDEYREAVLRYYPSAWRQDSWLGREDRIVARNGYANFGLSEYCGCIAYWVALRDDRGCRDAALADRWFEQICPKFTERFASLTPLATFSNGEVIYRRIDA